ncbi:kelch repeat-containing protein [Cellulomonas endophytica]|uniref:Kelch repeat-containing protein n=1 Tax=Cellulomonas endophytica TaxID=2494735 RepID=UPI0010134F19|nr:kelch repeat-containing protein [Cellulomonas endophytica]
MSLRMSTRPRALLVATLALLLLAPPSAAAPPDPGPTSPPPTAAATAGVPTDVIPDTPASAPADEPADAPADVSVAAVPAAPPRLEGAGGDRGVGLLWDPSPSTGVAGYHVFRSTTLPVATTGTPLTAAPQTARTFLDTGRTNGTVYHYAVVAVDAAGARSAPSPMVSVRPAAPPVPTGATLTWAQRASAAIGRREASGAALGGRLYVFGGQYTGNTQTLRSDRYDPATDAWTRLRDLPELLTHAPVVADGTTLWILGGYVGLDRKDSSPRVWKYDTVTDTYSAGPSLPAPRGGGGAVLVGRTLHYFTGAVRRDSTGGPTTDHPEHWTLAVDGGTTWQPAAPVPNPRNHVGTALLGGTVYLVGGQHGEAEGHTPQTQVDAYDVATGTWRRVADLPVPRGHISASTFVWNGKLLVLGGSVLGAAASRTIFEYDPATNAWTTRTDLPEALRSPVADLIDGRVVVNGGRTATETSPRTWVGSVAGGTDTTPPGAPTGVTAALSGGSVVVRWTARTETDLAGYAVHRATSTPVPTTGTPLSGATPLTGTSFTDAAPPAGTTVHYVVTARDRAGNTGAPSTTVSVAVPGTTGTGTWAPATALPVALLDGGGAAIGTTLYVVGGKTSAAYVSTLRVLDTATGGWTTGAPLPGAAVENPAVATDGRYLYVAGGSTAAFSGAVRTVHRYDPAANTWTRLADLATARGGAAAVVRDGVLWVLGGMDGSGASLATTERLTLTGGTWTAGPALATARDNAAAAATTAGILVVGGRTRLASGTEVAGNLAGTELLAPGATTWRSAAPVPTGRRSAAVGVLGGEVVVAGGERRADGTVWPQTEAWNPATGTWRTLTAMRTPRHGAAAAVVGGRLHVVGGGTTGGRSFSTVHEVLTPGTAPRDTTPPGAPTGVTATASAEPAVTVGWAARTETDLAGYRVHRSTTTPVPTSGTPASGTALLTGTTFTDRAVTAGATLHYVVVAVDRSGNVGPASAVVTATVPPTSSPGFSVSVRFADATAPAPPGHVRDWGQAYGARTGTGQGSGLVYGWVRVGTTTPLDLTRNGRLRTGTPTTDPRLTGVVHMDWQASMGTTGTAVPGSWEVAVPNGLYVVSATVGDAAGYTNSTHTLGVEDQNAVARAVPTSTTRFFAATRTVRVSDGRLTLSPAGGTNTKLVVVDVDPVPTTPARPRIASVDPRNGATGVLRDRSITAGLDLTGGGIDRASLSQATARLTSVPDGATVPVNVTTSGGGDVVVLTPDVVLVAGRTYRFDVTSGLRDVAGNAFHPWSSVFTAGTALGGTGLEGVAFDKRATPATGQDFTSTVLGPDGKLYAGTLQGYLFRYPVAADGTLGTGERIDTVRTHAGGARTIIGLAFDPAATADHLVLWVTENRQYIGVADVPDWTGRILRLSGPALATAQAVVVGLPRSARDHETNSLAFHAGALYLTQGSNTAMGAPDVAWELRPERVLTAAVLRLDPARLPATLPLDVRTPDGGGTYDPSAPGAALTLHATGVRNAYDLVWHSNGRLYVPTNGSGLGGAFPATPATLPPACSRRIDGAWTGPRAPGVADNPVDETDWVFRVSAGGYYGHPNPARCEWVFNGGNPTTGPDPFEASVYPVGVQPDRNYRLPEVYDAGMHASADGVVEYLGNAFGGALRGRLVVARYSASQDLMVLDPSGTDGRIVSRALGVAGFTGFDHPLDLAQHVPSGSLYVTELGGRRITQLVPRAG